MFVAVNQYIDLLADPACWTRTLGVVDVLMKDASGRPQCFVGNRSVVFKIRHNGRVRMLKCYTRPKPNLRRIYGEHCLRDELFISDRTSGEYVDVVVMDWVEGRSLRRAIADALGDTEAVSRLSAEFDRFALELLEADWAHGDLKPDNIIVDCEGRMHAIDFDAVYRPDLADTGSDESGTAAFQHPLRTAALYDKSMDDYPAALISTALHALSADGSLHRRFDTDDVLLIDPREAVKGRSRALQEVLRIFAAGCRGAEYRVARMLESPVPQLSGLRELLGWLVRGAGRTPEGTPVLCERDGLWGYVCGGRFVIAPVFDSGFEFSEGLAAVSLGGFHHYVSPSGERMLSVGECLSAKPFVDGYAAVTGKKGRFCIDRSGRAVYPPPSGWEQN